MDFSTHWKWCSLLLVLPFYACAPLPPQACVDCATAVQVPRYAVARPHACNDYPVSYRVQVLDDGRTKAVDQHTLTPQFLLVDSARAN